MNKLFLIPLLALVGCTSFPIANECAMSEVAKCAAELRVESWVNEKLDNIGSASRLDYDIACPPDYVSSCPDPVFGGDEMGDFEVDVITVTP